MVFSKLKDSLKKSQRQSLEDSIKVLLLQYNKIDYKFLPKRLATSLCSQLATLIMPAYANIYEISYYAQNYVSLVCQSLVNSYT